MVGLRELGARRRLRAHDVVQLGPRLRPARLAARRPRAAARPRAEAAGVLEGRQPRPPSTAAAGSQDDDARRRPRRARERRGDHGGHAGDQGHDPQPLEPASSSPPATRTSSRRRRSARRRAATARGWRAAALRRGDAYTAIVYTPSTNESQRREAGNEIDRADLVRFRALILPASGDRFQSGSPRLRRCCSRPSASSPQIFRGVAGRDGIPLNQRADPRRRSSSGPYRRTWELAQELRDEAETQEDLVQSVLTYLRRGFAYTETPHAGGATTSTASCSTPRPATASSSRARWRCCCGWPACPRAWSPASPPGRSTPRRRSTWCATSTPTRGSRSGTAASAGSPSTRRPPPPRRARSPTRRAPAPGRAPASGRRAWAATCRPTPAAAPPPPRRARRGCRSC